MGFRAGLEREWNRPIRQKKKKKDLTAAEKAKLKEFVKSL